jgi:hypothetical protein
MQLTSTVRTEAAVARLPKAVPPPLTWYLLAKEMNRRVVVKLGGGYSWVVGTN